MYMIMKSNWVKAKLVNNGSLGRSGFGVCTGWVKDGCAASQSYAGHVHAASGYRTTASGSNEKRQIDWALLRVPKARHLTNMVVTYGEISSYADTIPLQPFPGIPRESTELFKLGRSTRKTWWGLFSGLKECAYPHA
ncbi:hypothetical protein H101_04142 [Trichophyton interdigitale H6]|nr:hypothetical protein H101_04142 [Trichophyton interdigitale H6]